MEIELHGFVYKINISIPWELNKKIASLKRIVKKDPIRAMDIVERLVLTILRPKPNPKDFKKFTDDDMFKVIMKFNEAYNEHLTATKKKLSR